MKNHLEILSSVEDQLKLLISGLKAGAATEEEVVNYIVEVIRCYHDVLQENTHQLTVLEDRVTDLMGDDIVKMAACNFIKHKGMEEEYLAYLEMGMSSKVMDLFGPVQ